MKIQFVEFFKTQEFIDDGNGNVAGVKTVLVNWAKDPTTGRWVMNEEPGDDDDCSTPSSIVLEHCVSTEYLILHIRCSLFWNTVYQINILF